MKSLVVVVFIIVIVFVFVYLGKLLSWKVRRGGPDTAQKSPYECGFSPFQSGRRPFSVYFFLFALLFLVFDVELVILMPLPLLSYLGMAYWGAFLFMVVLLLGLFHEWREGSLEWVE